MPGNPGMNKLARSLRKEMTERSRKPEVLELGTVQGDLSILTDHFPLPIPKGEYMIARDVSRQPEILVETWETSDGDPAHIHIVPLPESMYPLQPGDRVLVAWVNQGTDLVVIDIVYSS